MAPAKARSKAARSKAALVKIYQRNGCMRTPNEARREEDGARYKKGYEIRLVLDTKREVAEVRRLLKEVGLKGGRPYKKRTQWVQPVYGREAMGQFQQWLKRYGRR